MSRSPWPANGPLGEFTPEKSARFEAESQRKAQAAVAFYRGSRAAELEVDMLMLRDSNLRSDADELDEDFDGDAAGKAVTAVDVVWGEPDEDACVADPERYGRYLKAIEDALWQVREDYVEGAREPSRSFGSSPWSSEAFPMAALGL